MGFNMSWVCAEGIDQDAFLDTLELRPTGPATATEDFGTTAVPLSAATTASGWQTMFAKYALALDAALGTEPPRIARLPSNSRCVVVLVLEHRMLSYSSLWQGGRQVWEILHDGRDHLSAKGDLPPQFAAIHATERMRQDEQTRRRPPGLSREEAYWHNADYIYEVPINTAAVITGFRHDQADSECFSNVRRLEPNTGNELTKLGNPPNWWQQTNSMRYGEPLKFSEDALQGPPLTAEKIELFSRLLELMQNR